MKQKHTNGRWEVEYRNSDRQLHREDGPAVVSGGGYWAWYINGKKHRLDGPAVISAEGPEWWQDGCRIK